MSASVSSIGAPNVGAGLDARAPHLDNGLATWVDVDMPEAIALRERLLPGSPRHHCIAGSLIEPASWLSTLPRRERQPVLLTIEGTLMYFEEAQIRAFLIEHVGALAGFVELMGDLAKDKVHPSVKAVGASAPFRSGFRHPAAALLDMHGGIRVTAHESLFVHERSHWGVFGWIPRLFPSLHDRLGFVLVAFNSYPSTP